MDTDKLREALKEAIEWLKHLGHDGVCNGVHSQNMCEGEAQACDTLQRWEAALASETKAMGIRKFVAIKVAKRKAIDHFRMKSGEPFPPNEYDLIDFFLHYLSAEGYTPKKK